MATSGTYVYASSAATIIKGALRLVGALSQGETPTSTQYNEAMEALNMMVKAFVTHGMPLWAIRNTTVTLLESTPSYSIGISEATNTAKPLKVMRAFSTRDGVDTPLRVITRDEYDRLPSKTSEGSPSQVYFEPLNTTSKLYVYPAPDADTATNVTITIVNQRPFMNFDATSDEPDFPAEWFEALKYGLAVRLAGEYGMDSRGRVVLNKEAEIMLQTVLGFGTEEGSVYFTASQ